jgi:uncharacterized glyoxalase superfamily protein PhnB
MHSRRPCRQQHQMSATQQVAFDKLADDGKVHEPLECKFWGAICGVAEDRFRVIWESNCYGS